MCATPYHTWKLILYNQIIPSTSEYAPSHHTTYNGYNSKPGKDQETLIHEDAEHTPESWWQTCVHSMSHGDLNLFHLEHTHRPLQGRHGQAVPHIHPGWLWCDCFSSQPLHPGIFHCFSFDFNLTHWSNSPISGTTRRVPKFYAMPLNVFTCLGNTKVDRLIFCRICACESNAGEEIHW